ncbi:alpha/beta fold hydrolase [Candidatus Uabimicrobium amorphum]|uniref:Hydrolase n=1 Tax=Uabimicrobium amorphum TaxID=2596890 RepID=A0A5S9ILL3_UABAM|nr:alpha/beta hydrolase [Candidatus Uabimicrobium amorphum]BBM83300.1 hydrolase [Candidatus Uabimicrobium amorphum]
MNKAKSGIAYQIYGDEGTPVVLIMGLGMLGSVWGCQIPVLSKKHRVLIFDHLGIGESDPLPRGGKSMAEMAIDVGRLLEEVGWESAHVIGISMGGMIAQHVTLMYPHRVRSLSLLATSAGGVLSPAPTTHSFMFWLKTLGCKSNEQRAQLVKELLFPKSYLKTLSKEQHEHLSQIYQRKIPKNVVSAHVKAVIAHNTKPSLHLLQLPVLILRPDCDYLVAPSENDVLHRLIKGSRLVSFPNAGHGILRQCTDEVNKELLAHLVAVDAKQI